MALIEMERVRKEFKVYKQPKGFLNSLKSIVHRKYETVKAVDDITFDVSRGELVGYIGPNGAGKSTTIKMLAGILVPTAGRVVVDGRVPHLSRKENAMHIGVVVGQRSQLYWDLPMEETFELYKKMYRVDSLRFKRNLEFYVELLDMKDFLRIPVRQLSLGQKMRGDLAVALLHDPDILYLDEPTIGLDVVAKDRIRHFMREVNEEKETTIILTTHDMDDIDQICDRIIMIDKGHIVYDGLLDKFKEQHGSEYMLEVDFAEDNVRIDDPRLKIGKEEGSRKFVLFNVKEISAVEAIDILLKNYKIVDLHLKEPNIEEIVRRIYESSSYPVNGVRQEEAKNR